MIILIIRKSFECVSIGIGSDMHNAYLYSFNYPLSSVILLKIASTFFSFRCCCCSFLQILCMAVINFCLILKCSFLILKFSHLLHIHNICKKKENFKILQLIFFLGVKRKGSWNLFFFFCVYCCSFIKNFNNSYQFFV